MKATQRLKYIIPFAVAAAIMIYFMPREGKFKYEFQKGKEWKHKTLTAPFDFPIYKNDNEFAAERRQVLSTFSPYYVRDTNISKNQIRDIEQLFNSTLQKPLSREVERLPQSTMDKLQEEVLPELLNSLNFVYGKGVRESNSVAESYLNNPNASVNVLNNFVATTYPVGETFTQQSAYHYITTRLRSVIPNNTLEQAFFYKLNLQQNIRPNLLYNEKLTTQAREDAMSKLSPTKGVVNVGQLIISKGEIVNETTHNTLESLRKEYEKRVGFSGSTWLLVLGQIFIICLIMAALYFYLTLIYDKPLGFKQICFVLMLIVIFYLLVLWTVRTQVANPYVIPLAVLPIFITTFFDSKLALFIHLITVSLISIIVPNSFEFYLLSAAAGMAAIYSMKDVYRRGKLYLTAIIIFLCYSILYSAFSLIKEGSFINFNWRPYFWFAVSAGLVLAAYQLVYLFEKIFGFTSDNTLMEIADTNQALLRELAEVAPATFQHCMQVANLAESAIREIGGNPLLVRVGALYHDVGKMNNPSYFIENQLQGFSPHKELSAEESASVIIKHVPDGISIAKKHRLPEVVIDFIRTHHGLSQVRYFRNLYREQNPDATDFSKFEYPGPNPTSKEQGVLMMADAVEAASRSLTTYTTESINGLVEGVAKTLIDDKLFDNTELTFADITTIKNTFKKKLQNIYHDRVVD